MSPMSECVLAMAEEKKRSEHYPNSVENQPHSPRAVINITCAHPPQRSASAAPRGFRLARSCPPLPDFVPAREIPPHLARNVSRRMPSSTRSPPLTAGNAPVSSRRISSFTLGSLRANADDRRLRRRRPRLSLGGTAKRRRPQRVKQFIDAVNLAHAFALPLGRGRASLSHPGVAPHLSSSGSSAPRRPDATRVSSAARPSGRRVRRGSHS